MLINIINYYHYLNIINTFDIFNRILNNVMALHLYAHIHIDLKYFTVEP